MTPYVNTSTNINSISFDVGLRNYMLSVYNQMTLALAISGFVAIGLYISPFMPLIWGTPLKWVAIFLPLVMSIGLIFMFDKLNVFQARIFLLAFSAAMGISLSVIFAVFKLGSVVQIFFISASIFGTAALYGYTTKRDLSGFGTFLIMGAVGIVIAGIFNVFLQLPALTFVINCLAVFIFTGLAAYENQTLKNIYYETGGEEREKAGVLGALNLYMSLINIFTSMLNLFGEKE